MSHVPGTQVGAKSEMSKIQLGCKISCKCQNLTKNMQKLKLGRIFTELVEFLEKNWLMSK